MARGDIKIVWEKRPVQIRPLFTNGLFHFWKIDCGRAVIELCDGTMELVEPKDFQFTDSESLFKSYHWQQQQMKGNLNE